MAKKVRIGIVGTGGIANGAHLPGYARIPDECEVVALCDIDPKALKSTSEKYPDIKHLFKDYKKLLEMDEIDGVSVCTPNFAHHKITVDALKAGKAVLCEKPIAINSIQAKEMVETARKTKSMLQVGYNSRFAPASQALKRFIDAGEIGEVYYARAQSLRQRGIPGWGVFIDKSKQGGGPLIDIGVHILDLTLWFMGHPKPVSASGVTYQKFGTRSDVVGFMGQWDHTKFTVEDFASALIRFENGASVQLEASFVANIPQEVHNTTLLGTAGGATSTPPTITQEKYQSLYTAEIKVPNANVNTHQLEMKAFVGCIRDKREPLVTGEQGLMVSQIMDAIYASSDAGKEVKILQ